MQRREDVQAALELAIEVRRERRAWRDLVRSAATPDALQAVAEVYRSTPWYLESATAGWVLTQLRMVGPARSRRMLHRAGVLNVEVLMRELPDAARDAVALTLEALSETALDTMTG